MKISLSKIQENIVEHGEGALLVEAGPGSGKTRVLTERIRRLLMECEGHFKILALTFTNKAANEMKERLIEFPDISQNAFIGTMHSFCLEVLTNRGQAVGINGLPNIFELYSDRKEILRRAVLSEPLLYQLLHDAGDKKEQDDLLRRWLEMIGSAKSDLLVPEMLPDDISSKVYEVYDKELKASNAIDYDDLLLLAYQLFIERPKIANFYRRQYRYICIDEAQDLNEAQYQLLRALCGTNYFNVMMVGDPKQAIFEWNGANPKYLNYFIQDFNANKIVMNENFRSSKLVVKAATSLSPDFKIEGQLPLKGEIKLFECKDQEDEALTVLDYLKKLQKNGHPDIEGQVTLDNCALIGRNRYVFTSIEKILKKRKWQYYKQISTQHQSETNLLIDFELCLRLLSNNRDRLHLNMFLTKWNIPKDEIPYNEFSNGLDLFNYIIENFELDEQEKAIITAIYSMEWSKEDFKFNNGLDILENFAKTLNKTDEAALVFADIDVWKKHWNTFLRSSHGGKHSLTTFLSHIALGTTQQPKQDGLALITVHSSKGLEFDVVIIMGMTEGVFPDYRATGEKLKEEKRNAFVAVTRSKRIIGFSYPHKKMMPWGDIKIQEPSRYLYDMELL